MQYYNRGRHSARHDKLSPHRLLSAPHLAGRFFRGALNPAQPGERQWEGMRLGVGTGMRRRRRGEPPSRRVVWLYDLLLSRSKIRLAADDAAGAVEDAQRAVELCCRAPAAYGVLATALEANGDGEGAAAVAREQRWLQSFA